MIKPFNKMCLYREQLQVCSYSPRVVLLTEEKRCDWLERVQDLHHTCLVVWSSQKAVRIYLASQWLSCLSYKTIFVLFVIMKLIHNSNNKLTVNHAFKKQKQTLSRSVGGGGWCISWKTTPLGANVAKMKIHLCQVVKIFGYYSCKSLALMDRKTFV